MSHVSRRGAQRDGDIDVSIRIIVEDSPILPQVGGCGRVERGYPGACWAGLPVRGNEPSRGLLMRRLIGILAIGMGVIVVVVLTEANRAEVPGERLFTIRSIGTIKKVGKRSEIVLEKKYQEGVLGLEEWSHIQVLWWFDRNDVSSKRSILRVHPRGDPANPLTGVFACRAPVRPNLIGLSLCKVLAVKDNVIEVDQIDALEDTPVVDIKPYAPGIDSTSGARVPEWAKPK